MKKLRIIVGGYIGLYPTGGATLDYIQYPLGLKNLGHDVYYIEDTMQYPVYQENKDWDDASGCIQYLKDTMEHFGMGDRWCYRNIADNECYGMTLEKVLEICRTADVFINVSCSTHMRDEYLSIPHRILIDSDPMFTQVAYYDELEGSEHTTTGQLIATHNYLFSFGENIGKEDCRIPTFGLNWQTTRQPICMDIWRQNGIQKKFGFTSILNWSGRKKMIYMGEEWGQKDEEFEKFISLPTNLIDCSLEMVINPPLNPESNFDLKKIVDNRWKLMRPKDMVATAKDYRAFIQSSEGEFSIAKATYVKSKSGWFSCRSACYLAAGNPVIAQETGWSEYIPAGSGLLAFHDMDSAIASLEAVNANKSAHGKAAVSVAKEFFDSDIVLTDLLNKLN